VCVCGGGGGQWWHEKRGRHRKWHLTVGTHTALTTTARCLTSPPSTRSPSGGCACACGGKTPAALCRERQVRGSEHQVARRDRWRCVQAKTQPGQTMRAPSLPHARCRSCELAHTHARTAHNQGPDTTKRGHHTLIPPHLCDRGAGFEPDVGKGLGVGGQDALHGAQEDAAHCPEEPSLQVHQVYQLQVRDRGVCER
jgi:hypothetical protein